MKTQQSLQPVQIVFTTAGNSVEPAPASPVGKKKSLFLLLYQTLTASSDLDIVAAVVPLLYF